MRFPVLLAALAASAPAAHALLPDEQWGFVDVRPGAHMFWWLYGSSASRASAPIVLWLQGGPGAGGSGYGNFGEMGPLDINQQPRNTTWLSAASLLFVDNPVGAGYSYVDSPALIPRNNTAIAADLVALVTAFVAALPDASTLPFYIVCESYGGKMGVQAAVALAAAVSAGTLKLNLRGVAAGDSWISGIDYVDTWAPFLRATSLMTAQAKSTIVDPLVATADAAVAAGNWAAATNAWGAVEGGIDQATPPGINFYNILNWSCEPLCAATPARMSAAALALAPAGVDHGMLQRLFARHVAPLQADPVAALMNGPIKAKLGLPGNVVWGSQSDQVFSTLSADFMRPVVDVVDAALAANKFDVIVYEGQVDLICGSMGAEAWMQKLTWPGMPGFYGAPKTPFYVDGDSVDPAGFAISSGPLSMYYILKAGHMVPQVRLRRWRRPTKAARLYRRIATYHKPPSQSNSQDQGAAALIMIKMITGKM
jgi:serine carboxypeptidase 1